MTYLFGYLVIVNILAFLLMGIDKHKARKGAWRIPERTLFLSALIGGSLGANLGMQLFQHKTKHRSFVIGMPAILIAQLLFGLFLCKVL
jgi:uncharacterized membrane protein YsdA (DUF1294 family)